MLIYVFVKRLFIPQSRKKVPHYGSKMTMLSMINIMRYGMCDERVIWVIKKRIDICKVYSTRFGCIPQEG